jgi:hypothetical protein
MNRRRFLEALAAGVATSKVSFPAVKPQTTGLKAPRSKSPRHLMAPVRVNPMLRHSQELRVALDGTWQFRLDPKDAGLTEKWYRRSSLFTDMVQVPGCWQGQGLGNDGPDEVWDFQLKTRTLRATYKGTGWYSKRFEVSKSWNNKRIFLNFGGAHPSATVWLNSTMLGENTLPFVPFGFEVTDLVRLGAMNTVVVRVHEKNRVFGLAFNFQGNWSGLYRGVDLVATGENSLDAVSAYPDLDLQRLKIRVGVGGTITAQSPLALQVSAFAWPRGGQNLTQTFEVAAPDAEFVMTVDSPRRWSPDSPNLYVVEVALKRGETTLDAFSERVGFVKLSTEGEHFLINGEPYFMRGTGDFALCPETGCPDTDRERWRRKLKTLREYGYNYVRCQSYLYPPEYFDIADEVGLLIQSEMGILGAWGGVSQYHTYQWPKPTPDNYPTLKRQWHLSVSRDVNHPSANIYCMSNESGAATEFSQLAWQSYADTKAAKPTAAVIWTDGGYNPDLPADFINSEAKAEGNFVMPPLDRMQKPLIQHEFRWWSSYPDIRLMSRYDGALRPYAAQIAIEAAQKQGQRTLLEKFAESSNQLQLIEAKGKMEMRRGDHVGLAGICHFNAMDCNPSPQGVLNEFYEKKVADAATWQQTNGDTVILASLGFDERVWGSMETRACKLRISDFSHPPFHAPTLDWNLETRDHKSLTSGVVHWKHEPFKVCDAGEIRVTSPTVTHPTPVRLIARLREGDRLVTNEWSIWLFPNQEIQRSRVLLYGRREHSWLKSARGFPTANANSIAVNRTALILTEYLDAALIAYIQNGGNAILVGTEKIVRAHPVSHFASNDYFFTPPANYPPYSDGQNGTVVTSHSAIDSFVHNGFADLNFYRLIRNAPPIDLNGFELNDHDPIIRVIHRFPVCYPLAYLLERQIGKGRLMMCAFEFDEQWVEARYLLTSLISYLQDTHKASCFELNDRQIGLIAETFS